MGKRKSKRKPQAKIKVKLEKTFTCLFCNHDNSIEVKLDREHQVGSLHCRTCGVQWDTRIHNLSEPVDVFSDWIDACEAEQARRRKQNVPADTEGSARRTEVSSNPIRKKSRREQEAEEEEQEDQEEEESDDDSFIVKDDDDDDDKEEEEENEDHESS